MFRRWTVGPVFIFECKLRGALCLFCGFRSDTFRRRHRCHRRDATRVLLSGERGATAKIRCSFPRVLTRESLVIDGTELHEVAQPVQVALSGDGWRRIGHVNGRSPIPYLNHLLVALDLPLPSALPQHHLRPTHPLFPASFLHRGKFCGFFSTKMTRVRAC